MVCLLFFKGILLCENDASVESIYTESPCMEGEGNAQGAEEAAMTTEGMDRETNERLDKVLQMRRTVRSFTDKVPPRQQIEQIIEAGLLAPYAAAAVGEVKLFRRFFVFERGGESIARVAEMAAEQMKATVAGLKQQCEANPAVAEKAGSFLKRLEMLVASGSVPITEAPYYVVIGEKTGIPPAEMQSLAHVLENMWLKATALGLGFRLISLTAQLGHNEDFCKLLGVMPSEFAFDGCTIGYATEWPPPTDRPSFEEAVSWFEG
jgi:nitroreductase